MKNKFILLFTIFVCGGNIFCEENLHKLQRSEALTFKNAGESAIAASKELQSEYAIHSLQMNALALGMRSYFPKLTLSAYEEERLSKISADSFMKNYAIGIEQLLFDGGRLRSSRKIQKAKLAIQYNSINRKANEISETAISNYRQILAARMMLQTREAGLKSLEEQRRIIKSELDLGIVLESDLAEADISIKSALIEILTAKMELEENETQFMEALGFDTMPTLLETIDVHHEGFIPTVSTVRSNAQARNPDLIDAQLAIKEKQEEVKYTFLSWVPTLTGSGSFSLRGNTYPLTHYTWSVGLQIQFAFPYLSGSSGITTGFEDRDTKNLRMQGSLEPLPDPSSGVNYAQAKIALDLQRANYNISFERLGRSAESLVAKIKFTEQKRKLAFDSQNLAAEKLELIKVKHKLGLVTSMDLMDAQIEYTQKELELVQSALAVLTCEHELEQLMDLYPGELKNYVN
ncbi:MAG: hypothetical protein Ta2B_05140 [Termitinemataceae bacterium]|nr:MAG: hypothetical protein Ta2B_05140 [Termitinemataceae bacterium]